MFGLVALALVPTIGLSAFMAQRYGDAERRVLEALRFDVANNLSFIVDGEMLKVVSTLKVLAASPDLTSRNFLEFRKFAALSVNDSIAAVAVLDASGQQLMSTFVPLDQPLPKRSDMSLFTPVFEGQTLMSDVIEGTAVKRPIISVAVPVRRDGQIMMILSGVVYPERLGGMFARAGVNPAWAAAIVDRQGRFIGRNLSSEQYIGKMARPELGAVARGTLFVGTFENTTMEGVLTGNSFRRSDLTGWTSVVSVPAIVLGAPLRNAIRWVFLEALTAAVLSVALASWLAARIAKSIRSFGEAASALVEGRPLPATANYISELSDVRTAFEHAETTIAARKRAEENVQFLSRELSHRSKNLIAVIQAVANRTARSEPSLEAFLSSFSKRLQGLAVSHDLLIEEAWQGAPLAQLVRDHLLPFVDKTSARVEVSCGNITITSTAAQALGLALHELATNASKYGALSGPTGKITVSCEILEGDPKRPLQVRWVESGGPLVQPPTRQGFGHVVIDRMASAAVNGRAELHYDPDGFKWSLTISREHFSDLADKNSVPDPSGQSAHVGSTSAAQLAIATRPARNVS